MFVVDDLPRNTMGKVQKNLLRDQLPRPVRRTVIRIEPLQHRDLPTARRLHAVFMPAYTQEAALLGLQQFPPLARTAEDIQRSGDMHLGAMRGERVARRGQHRARR